MSAGLLVFFFFLIVIAIAGWYSGYTYDPSKDKTINKD